MRVVSDANFTLNLCFFQDAVVAEVTGNGDVAKVENGDVKPEVVLVSQNS